MLCPRCGAPLGDNDRFCPKCGAPVENIPSKTYTDNTAPKSSSETNTLCVVGFVLSFFIAIAGLVCSIIGLKQVQKSGESGKGFAIAGIVISCIEIVAVIIVFLIYFTVILSLITGLGSMNPNCATLFLL